MIMVMDNLILKSGQQWFIMSNQKLGGGNHLWANPNCSKQKLFQSLRHHWNRPNHLIMWLFSTCNPYSYDLPEEFMVSWHLWWSTYFLLVYTDISKTQKCLKAKHLDNGLIALSHEGFQEGMYHPRSKVKNVPSPRSGLFPMRIPMHRRFTMLWMLNLFNWRPKYSDPGEEYQSRPSQIGI